MLSSRSVPLLHSDLDYSSFSHTTATKTPGRVLKGRAGLQENTFQHGSLTANPREKKVTIQSPLRQKVGGSKIILHEPTSKGSAALSQSRPLGDKTPRPNRQANSLFTPSLRTDKNTKFKLPGLLDAPEEIAPLQPPSSARRNPRVPRISQTFKTPITKGDHWNVSDISIELGGSTSDTIEEETDAPDYSDPEYMPPRAEELPYEPSFEMPDYKVIGKALRHLSRPCDFEPSIFALDEVDVQDLLKGCDSTAYQLELPSTSDNDEIFGPRTSSKAVTKTSTGLPVVSLAKGIANRPVSRPMQSTRASTLSRIPSVMQIHRPATSFAVRNVTSKTTVPPPRPGTSVSKARTQAAPPANMRSTDSKVARRIGSKLARPKDWVDSNADKLINVEDNLDDGIKDFRFEI